jgi:mortality factor 4-like protein 1
MENIQKQKELKLSYLQNRQLMERNGTESDSSIDKRPKKPKTAKILKPKEETPACRVYMNIDIPDSIKIALMEDFIRITRDKQLPSLPRKIPIAHILREYQNEENLEFCNGLERYFEHALSTILLYQMERKQYCDIVKRFKDRPISEIYGIEHLLRLIGMTLFNV